MKLLIVENKERTGEYLTEGSTETGLMVDLADSGLNDYHLAMTGGYDLIILDTMLPDVNGQDIMHMLRSTSKGVSTLLLTALGTIEYCTEGPRLGTGDYLVKPPASAELLTWMRILLWRGAAVVIKSQFQTADLTVDLVSYEVTCNGIRIALTSKEFTLLESFLRHQGEVLSCSLIASRVQGTNLDNDTSTIGVAAKQSHSKISNNLESKLIQTMCGVGHILKIPDGQ